MGNPFRDKTQEKRELDIRLCLGRASYDMEELGIDPDAHTVTEVLKMLRKRKEEREKI